MVAPLGVLLPMGTPGRGPFATFINAGAITPAIAAEPPATDPPIPDDRLETDFPDAAANDEPSLRVLDVPGFEAARREACIVR
jgi:hypothetical protein